MSREWFCNTCDIIYAEKPTFTTSCPKCGKRLDFEPNKEAILYSQAGRDIVDNTRCGLCAKKLSKTFVELLVAGRFDETKVSFRIHKKCVPEAIQCHYKIKEE